MGIFSERDLDLREMDSGFSDTELEALQRFNAINELTDLEARIDRLIERWTYYDEPPTKESLTGLKADVRYVKKIIV